VTGRLPQLPPSAAFALALNLALDRLIPRAALGPLDGRSVRLHVQDAGLRLTVRFAAGRFLPAALSAPADVIIRADAHTFVLLALRRADPDALVFQRHLVLEGDTEAGLALKNALDAVEWPGPLKLLVGKR
jgi:predicted lipid carrier protein YhbT